VSFRRNGEGKAALSMMAKAGKPTFRSNQARWRVHAATAGRM